VFLLVSSNFAPHGVPIDTMAKDVFLVILWRPDGSNKATGALESDFLMNNAVSDSRLGMVPRVEFILTAN
jgi:hypothetical protein